MQLKLLISPLAKAAYFADYLDVAAAEFKALFADPDFTLEQTAGLDFVCVNLAEQELPRLARLSFLQAVFEDTVNGLIPLTADANFMLPGDLVYGVKYQGKTNELVTQLAINLAFQYGNLHSQTLHAEPGLQDKPLRLLDPMAGKGTSLFWAMRYGCEAIGIEQDRTALAGFQQHVKKQCKLLRLKNRQSEGFIGKANRQGLGKFMQFEIANKNPVQNLANEFQKARLISGDSVQAKRLIQNKTVSLIVADLPYGIQHFTASGSRNPLVTLESCAEQWVSCLRHSGAMVLIFNNYQPKRQALIDLFCRHGLEEQDFSAPHRMSESIVRDLVVFTKSAA